MQIRLIKFVKTISVIAFLCIGQFACAQDTTSSQPNILFFFTDDQGWNHHSVPMIVDGEESVAPYFQTPNLERLAESGLFFTSAYSAAPMCNHSRRAMHVGVSAAQVIFSGKSEQEQASATTIAQVMQGAGYRTAHYGKWSPGPSTNGLDFFTESDGNFNNGDGNLNEAGDPKQIFGITERASAFMKESVAADKPFYIQLSHFAPHTQAHSLPDTLVDRQALEAAGQDADLVAMTADLDSGVGALMDKIVELGIEDNTYIVFTSDHGQTDALSANTPLKLGKGTLWEGGIRVPLIISGPGIQADSVSHERVVSLDFFPTFATLAGVTSLPDNLEGGSLLPILHDGSTSKVERLSEDLVMHFPTGSGQATFQPMSVLYDGDYKLVKLYATDELLLFNITEDIGEENDLSDAMPKRVLDMHERMTAYLDDVGVVDFGEDFDPNAPRTAMGMGGMGMVAPQ